MITLDRNLLYNFATAPLRRYSDNFEIKEAGNPFLFEMNNRRYAVHISYVHDSGNNRSNDDEARIQIGRNRIEQQLVNKAKGYETYYIGFFSTGDVFTAWDPEKVEAVNASTVTSLYARKSDENKVLENGAAIRLEHARNLRRVARHTTLPSSALGFYLQNSKFFHRVPDNRDEKQQTLDLIKILAEHPEFWDEKSRFRDDTASVPINREKVTFTITRTGYRRNTRFSRDVRSAYNFACSICSKQLDLVEAAHIIPHNNEQSIDHISNGIALCVEHHRLYDDALLIIDSNRKLLLNFERLKFLEEIKQIGGSEKLILEHTQEYWIPDDSNLRPSEKYIEIGKKIRLGNI